MYLLGAKNPNKFYNQVKKTYKADLKYSKCDILKLNLVYSVMIGAIYKCFEEKNIAVYLVANDNAIPFYEKLRMTKSNEVMEYSKVE